MPLILTLNVAEQCKRKIGLISIWRPLHFEGEPFTAVLI